MKAAVLREFGAPLTLAEVATPAPGPGEVLVRVKACGIDGTDLKLLDGFGYTPDLPFIMGHEPAGDVAAIGRDVGEFRVGDRVIPYIFLIPKESPWYGTERAQLCPEMTGVLGVKGLSGGYAEFLVVPAHQLVRLPDGVAWEDGAVLCDAGLTAYHAVSRARLTREETVLVTGVGGVGSFVVQLARLAGARTIAVDRGRAKIDRARRLGAEQAIDALDSDIAGDVRRFTEGRGVDCVLDVVGTQQTLSAGVDSLAVGGRLGVVGYTPDDRSAGGKRLAQNEFEILGSRGGSRSELRAVVQLAAEGRIESIVTDARPLREANEALAELREGRVLGRMVLRIPE